MIVFRPSARMVFSHPAHFIAFGFGAGLSPFAPGTAGTLLAFPIWWAIGGAYEPAVLFGLLAFLFVVGVWACDITGRHLGIADHGGMCWDEVVAFLLVLILCPAGLWWQVAAFVLFRAFDIAKPPPIRAIDARMKNGIGVMLDDLVAAAFALLAFAIVVRLTGWPA
jgi:phosphatidylglycerophosphatase A